MDEFGFPYTLQSNASLKLFPNNRCDHFKVQLAKRMQLDENWVVGMSVIHYPLNFINSNNPDDSSLIKGKYSSDTSSPIPQNKKNEKEVIDFMSLESEPQKTEERIGRKRSKRLVQDFPEPPLFIPAKPLSGVISREITPDGRHDVDFLTVEHSDYLDQLQRHNIANEELAKTSAHLEKQLSVCENAGNDRVQGVLQDYQNLRQKCEDDSASKDLLYRETLTQKENVIEKQKQMISYWRQNFISLAHLAYKDANQMNHPLVPKYLYIQCSIVKTQLVGDAFIPHLTVSRVPPIRMNGETWTDRREFPDYYALGCYNFNEIEIDIRDECGRFVSFGDGVVIITLHFKRVPGAK
jgi:hypothetical protein